jgi:16S rRNA A1518/A1519 N6-dimethyltransferase RsmA/KsgA/DIM1 with predicted DNA glycosylase/AP lyase activity
MADTIRPYIGQDILEIGSGIRNITQELMAGKHYYRFRHQFLLP